MMWPCAQSKPQLSFVLVNDCHERGRILRILSDAQAWVWQLPVPCPRRGVSVELRAIARQVRLNACVAVDVFHEGGKRTCSILDDAEPWRPARGMLSLLEALEQHRWPSLAL